MKILISLFFLLISTLLIVSPIFAQVGNDGNKAQINLGSKQSFGIKAVGNPNANVGVITSNAIKILFIFGGLAVLVFLIWGAFDWITSGGDKEKVASARRKIVNALIGFALLALAGFIVSLFGQIVGFNPLNTPALPKLGDAPTNIQAPAAQR